MEPTPQPTELPEPYNATATLEQMRKELKQVTNKFIDGASAKELCWLGLQIVNSQIQALWKTKTIIGPEPEGDQHD